MHRAHVASVEALTPNLLRVELGGLHAFEVLGPDTFAFALVTTSGPPLDDAFTIDDYQQVRTGGTIRGAYYTVRHWDAERSVVTFWVLLHGHDDGVGSWMHSARRGDELLLWGPRRGFVPPPGADHLLLVADETGLAAVASIIEATESNVTIDAVLEAVDPHHRPPLPHHPRLATRWIDRGAEPAGTTHALVDAACSVDTQIGTWAAFGAAESRTATRIRRFIRDERGLPASHVSMTGYWRRER